MRLQKLPTLRSIVAAHANSFTSSAGLAMKAQKKNFPGYPLQNWNMQQNSSQNSTPLIQQNQDPYHAFDQDRYLFQLTKNYLICSSFLVSRLLVFCSTPLHFF